MNDAPTNRRSENAQGANGRAVDAAREGGMMSAALAYAKAGFPVFPCREAAERDQGSKAPYTSRGLLDASCDERAVRDWWEEHPRALIGFPTGRRTRALVVDLDAKDSPADAMLLALRRFHDFARTAVALTQSDGLHVYFAYPDETTLAELRERKPDLKRVANRANLFRHVAGAPAELAHVDVRGEGGYVIAPPSRMANGRAYEWVVRPGRAFALAAAPRRLLDLICGVEDTSEPRTPSPPPRLERAGRYVEAAIRGVCADARSAPSGERNQRVFECALRLGDFVRGGQMTTAEAEALLLANLPSGVKPGERKIKQTIKNGLAAGTRVFAPEGLAS